jgi:hypothetical protein
MHVCRSDEGRLECYIVEVGRGLEVLYSLILVKRTPPLTQDYLYMLFDAESR